MGERQRALEELVNGRTARGLPDPGFWRGRRVLVTGHTGFIGGWLCTRLLALGAEPRGFALPPNTSPSFFGLTRLGEQMDSVVGDIRSADELGAAVTRFRPQIVFHLAAQAFVGKGYSDPTVTFDTNLMGTVNLLEAARHIPPEAVVAMTSDKVYAAGAGERSHREDDLLGPPDPYGASKACCELAVEAYARSFFAPAGIGLASVRAGNVIGGGDWGIDRLVPDAVRAFAAELPLALRRPRAVRPWQHVLDAIDGLMLVAEAAVRRCGPTGAWNIGPAASGGADVGALAQMLKAQWGSGARIELDALIDYPEAPYLAIDSGRARSELGLRAPWPLERAVVATVTWYKAALAGGDVWALTQAQIAAREADAAQSAAEPVL